MPGVNFELVRQRIGMQDVLQQLQFEATFRRGDQWRGPCPVRGSGSPRSRSFSVNVRLGRGRDCHAAVIVRFGRGPPALAGCGIQQSHPIRHSSRWPLS